MKEGERIVKSTDNKDIRSDWNDQRLDMCTPENVIVDIHFDISLLHKLSPEEVRRLAPKLLIVEKAAARMAANMLKGTLKYVRDDWDIDTWLRYLEDDAADTLNYIGLIKYCREQSSK